MTREEALYWLDTIPTIGEQVDALEMAIKALEQEPCEVWNGIHGQVVAPKGTFHKIWEDAEKTEQEPTADMLDQINGEIKEYCEKNCIDGDIVADELSRIIDKYRQEG